MTGRGRGTGAGRGRKVRARELAAGGTQGQHPARLEDPTRRARGDRAVPLADRDETREVSKQDAGERAWLPRRCAASSAEPRRRAAGGQGAERCPGPAPADFIPAPSHTPSAFPEVGEWVGGGRRGEGDAAVRGRGRCPDSPPPPPPPLQHLKVLCCPRRKRRSLEALLGAESASEPEPGRGEKREETRTGCALTASLDLGGFFLDPPRQPAVALL